MLARPPLLVLAALTCLAAAAVLASPSATPLKHSSLKLCNKQADARQLTGAARAQFIKECQGGKHPARALTPAAPVVPPPR